MNTSNDRFKQCVDIDCSTDFAGANATFHQNEKLIRETKGIQIVNMLTFSSRSAFRSFNASDSIFDSVYPFSYSHDGMSLGVFSDETIMIKTNGEIHAIAVKKRFALLCLPHAAAAASAPDFVELWVNKSIFAPHTSDLFAHTCAVY